MTAAQLGSCASSGRRPTGRPAATASGARASRLQTPRISPTAVDRSGADGTGAMPIETLGTFNRIKALTQDVATIVAALRLIPGLQVSDPSEQGGQTVQRTRTLPAKDDSEVGPHLPT